MLEIRKAVGHEKRRYNREITDIKSVIEEHDMHIVNMSENSLGFLSDVQIHLNGIKNVKIKSGDSEENIKLKITRPTNADLSLTGFEFYYGAEILDRKKLNDAATA